MGMGGGKYFRPTTITDPSKQFKDEFMHFIQFPIGFVNLAEKSPPQKIKKQIDDESVHDIQFYTGLVDLAETPPLPLEKKVTFVRCTQLHGAYNVETLGYGSVGRGICDDILLAPGGAYSLIYLTPVFLKKTRLNNCFAAL